MAIQILNRKKQTKRVDFMQFLSGVPARDYVFQHTPYEEQIREAASLLKQADAVIIGAGAGLSTAAGLSYGGKRFRDNFGDFIKKYGREAMTDMYSAGFYPFLSEEEKWGYWSKHAYLNRIEPAALPLYQAVYELVKDKPHFVLTTNVDHQFWKAGFADEDIFATQRDYGEIQCEKGCHDKVYDAVELFQEMNQARKNCGIPSELVPRCPVCGRPMSMNLRADDTFVEDAGWRRAAGRYQDFLRRHQGLRVVLLEPGVGGNTPGIIKFPFWRMAAGNPALTYACINLVKAYAPEQIASRSICIDADIGTVLRQLSRRAG